MIAHNCCRYISGAQKSMRSLVICQRPQWRGNKYLIFDHMRICQVCSYAKKNIRVGSTPCDSLLPCDKSTGFLPEATFGLRVLSLPACVCVYVCVRVSINHEFVRAITHQPFKLGSPNVDQRCKRPWLRALKFCVTFDRDLQGQIELKVRIYPILSLCMPWLTTN